MAVIAALKPSLAVVSCLCALYVSSSAYGQITPEPETVASRQREGLDPLGARIGAFQLFPALALQHVSDDNVFATRSDAVSDSAIVWRPALTLRSDWNRNSLSAGASAALNRYSDLSMEDHDNSNMFINGRWDTADAGFFYADVTHSTNHEGRESADDARGLERAKFTNDSTSIGFRRAPGRLVFQVDFDKQSLDYDDVAGVNGPINHDDRDRDQLTRTFRVGYRMSDGYSMFLQALDRNVDYDFRFDDNGFERSSNGYELTIGAALDVTEVVFGDIFVGRKSNEFDDPRFSDIGGTSFGMDVSWNITRLTTLNFQGRQEVTPTTILASSGIDETRLGMRADHELLRNLIMSLEWNKEIERFKGIERRDENRITRFGSRYLMNKRMEIELDYLRRARDSDAADDLAFSKRLITIQLKGQL